MTTRMNAARPFFGLALCVGAFLAVTVAAAVARELGAVDSVTAKRAAAMGLGVVLIAAGNLAPKLGLFHRAARDAGQAHGAERFAGRTLVLAGAAVFCLWLFWPSDWMMLASSLVVLAAFTAVVANWGRLALGQGGALEHSADPLARAAAVKRLALLQILFGLFWTFAMFAADTLWGDDVVLWMLMAFSMLLVLSHPLSRLTQACDRG